MQIRRITGIGSALVDILINQDDLFLAGLDKKKGGRTLVDDKEIQKILSKSCRTPVILPGGATCNTIVGVANLGGRARFIGTRGDDIYGEKIEDHLVRSRVEADLSVSTSPTGKVLSVITPDAQRSMFTFLGASAELDPLKISPELFRNTAITITEGYLLFNPDFVEAALKTAKAAGSLVALDLSSFEVVNSFKDLLKHIIRKYVDILIANEDEAKAYTGFEDEKKEIKALSEDTRYAVLKIGKRGSYVSAGNSIIKIEPESGSAPVDTTGAGDLWASGFLFGLANGFSPEKSARIGSVCGYEACRVMGTSIPQNRWEKIKRACVKT